MSEPTPTPRSTAVNIMRSLGHEPDPWQIEVLDAGHPRLLLNCCRQAGKTTVVGILGLVEALFKPMTRVLLLSRSHRQSKEMFRQLCFFHKLLGSRLLQRQTAEELEFTRFSRIVCLPCNEQTIRGYANVDLVVIDEAARVPDDLYRAVRPMLAVSGGRMICLSTPYGKRGFFWDAWANGGRDWQRIEIPAKEIPRIKPEFLNQEQRALGESWYRQEYCCSFEALEGLVYPNLARCVVPVLREDVQRVVGRVGAQPPPLAEGWRRVGGIDFGFRNPFAAVWGVVDRDGILWLTGEHYARQQPLSHHAEKLPRQVRWYADPSGATEIAELRCAGFAVSAGRNALRPGIAALTARINNGTLRILEGRCPNLLAEAGLYRYSDEPSERYAEVPVDEHNHALAALRYLIGVLDARHMAGRRTPADAPDPSGEPVQKPKPQRSWQEMVEDDSL
jgi:hypothetical protein